MGLSTVVALVRNALCVFKALTPGSMLPFVLQTPLLIDLSSYLYCKDSYCVFFQQSTDTTLIEWCIGITQILAFYLNVTNGYQTFIKSYRKYNKLSEHKYLCKLHGLKNELHIEYYIIDDGLTSMINKEIENIISSVLEMICGICFLFLFGNSLHLHPTAHPKQVINALIVMNIALIYFLILMWNTYKNRNYDNIKSNYIYDLLLKEKSLFSNIDNGIIMVSASAGFKNSYKALQVLSKNKFQLNYENLDNEDNDLWLESMQNDFDDVTKVIDEINRNNSKSSYNVNLIKTNLQEQIYYNNNIVYLDLIYFILNFIAFYGYTIGILAYYYPLNSNPSAFIKLLKLGLDDDFGDFWGNFAGDLAWTIEPYLILFIGPVVDKMKKSDDDEDKDDNSNGRSSRSKTKSTSNKNRSRSRSRKGKEKLN